MRTVGVRGTASGAWAELPEVAARLLALEGARGAALVVHHQGQRVVDVKLGDYADDGLQLVFSVSKAISAIAVAHASASGLIDVDAPLSQQWPELSRPQVAGITARDVLSHRSGLASLDRELSLEEVLSGVDEREITTQEPYWAPGSAHGYHAFTFGTLIGGWFRRATGETLGDYIERAIARPLGVDVWLGLPQAEHSRVEIIDYPAESATTDLRASWSMSSGIPPGSTALIARRHDLFNDPRLWSASLPSTSGVASAGGLADLFAATLDGTLLSAEALADLTAPQAHGLDRMLGITMHYGSGVQLPFPQFPMLGPRSFGHEAAGGSAVMADPDTATVVAWTTTGFPAMVGASIGLLALAPSVRHCLDSA